MIQRRLQWQKKSIATLAGVLVLALTILCQGASQDSTKKVPLLILDTDISSDVDDVGAVALLHGLANQGNVRILAMMVSSGDPWSVPCLAAINTWFGRPNIPIGMIQGENVQHQSKYTKNIAEEFPHQSATGADAPEAVNLYRRLLAAQADKSVTLVTIGYLTNLRNLLESKADAYSPLDGRSLVLRKVQHLVCMGGQYPTGREWNFYQDAPAAAYVVDHWPTPIVFSGFEIGKDILTGAGLKKAASSNPIRRSYELYNNLTNRPSWDQIALYYAVKGQQVSLWSSIPGKNTVQTDGSNVWQNKQDDVNHAYLVQEAAPSEITMLLEQLMLSTP
ncbi:MAG: nucleoside hydrolase [Candidatus Electrothrix sp. AR3]|nr:nucleoside hydrolase [Candidatus Electrothrix sp. AR3]